MNCLDHRGCTVSGAAPAALESFERALAAYQGWRDGADQPLALAVQEAPGFVMAHVLQAYLLVCSRDPRRVALARPTLARAAALPANPRERLHVAAIAALLDDDDFDVARRPSATCSASSRATRSRCRSRTRSTTSAATRTA